ncbi:MAG: ester cyclase [Acidobacteriota bacterium]
MDKKIFFYLIILILLSGIVGCEKVNTAKLDVNKEIVLQFTEAVNNHNYDELDNLVAADFVRHCQATPEVKITSLKEFKKFAKMYSESFPDMKGSVKMMVAEGDFVAAYATFTGTQKGPMGPLPASDKKMESKTIGIFLLEKKKIKELWIEWDNLAILTQLGHFPPPVPKAE